MEASTLGTLSKRIIVLLHAVHDCPGRRTAAITRYVSFAQITCFTRQSTLLIKLPLFFIVQSAP